MAEKQLYFDVINMSRERNTFTLHWNRSQDPPTILKYMEVVPVLNGVFQTWMNEFGPLGLTPYMPEIHDPMIEAYKKEMENAPPPEPEKKVAKPRAYEADLLKCDVCPSLFKNQAEKNAHIRKEHSKVGVK